MWGSASHSMCEICRPLIHVTLSRSVKGPLHKTKFKSIFIPQEGRGSIPGFLSFGITLSLLYHWSRGLISRKIKRLERKVVNLLYRMLLYNVLDFISTCLYTFFELMFSLKLKVRISGDFNSLRL